MGLTRENKKLFICPEESMNTAGICRFGLPAAISSSGGRTCILLGATFPAGYSQATSASGWSPSELWGAALGSDLAFLSTLVQGWTQEGQATQGDCSLPFCPLPAWPVPVSPTHGWPSSGLAPGKYSSTGFPGNQGANQMSIPPSITCNIPLNPRTRPAYLILSAVHHTLGCHSRPCFRLVSSPIHQTIDISLCCWLWALSLILKLGKHRPCKPWGSAQQTEAKLNPGLFTKSIENDTLLLLEWLSCKWLR